MGVVYRARDTHLDRTVAIKVLPADKVFDQDRRQRFAREAKAASALNHPNITAIFDIGTEAGADFLVMEYVPGRTLDRVLPANGLPVRETLTYAIAIAGALAAAHHSGIVHRDLKPSNLMITDSGIIKVLDFGVAKLREEALGDTGATRTAALTQEGMTVGTPAYMSPEQAEARPVDGRSDIFSFGSVLYEMVTGRRAFTGESRLAVMSMILHEEPPAPSQLREELPPELERIIQRCLRKDPNRRFQTMADLKVALEDVALESTAAPRPVVAAPPARPVRSRRWALAAISTVAAAGLVGGAYLLQTRRARQDGEPLRAVPLTSLSGVVRSPSLAPLGNTVVFTWTGPGQDNPDVYVQQIGAGSPLRLTNDPGNDYSPTWSPDGRTIAFLRRGSDPTRSELRLIPPLGGPERKVTDIPHGRSLYRPISISWCPDASCVVVTASQSDISKPDAIFAIAVDTGERRQLTIPPAGTFDMDPMIAPDGRSLIFRRDATPFSGQFYRLSLKEAFTPDGDQVSLTPTVNAGKATWTPDGREIVFGNRGALWRVDALRGGQPSRLPFVGQDGGAPTMSRDSDGRQRLVYVRSFTDGNVWRIDTSAPGAPASPPVVAIASTRSDGLPNLSADERQLTFMSNRSGESEVWVAKPDGTNAIQLTSLAALPGFPRWSPDGSTIVFHGDPNGRADVITVPAGGGRIRIITTDSFGGGFPSFSRDGRSLYISSNRRGVFGIWKIPLAGGQSIPISPGEGAIAIESYDGREVFYIEAADRSSPIWRVPVSGGTPEKVLDGVALASFDVVEKGIYYIDRVAGGTGAFYGERNGGEARLQFYDFATRQSTTVAHNLGPVGAGMTASRDGKTIFYSRIDSAVDELMVVDDFR